MTRLLTFLLCRIGLLSGRCDASKQGAMTVCYPGRLLMTLLYLPDAPQRLSKGQLAFLFPFQARVSGC